MNGGKDENEYGHIYPCVKIRFLNLSWTNDFS